MEIQKDHFQIGTPATGGTIKVYFEDSNADEMIKKARALYFKHVESTKIKKMK